MTQLYEFYSEDLSNVGGGGSNRDRTTINWSHTTDKTVDKIKLMCENDYFMMCEKYNRTPHQINWTEQNGIIRSQDLSFVMYTIKPITLV